MTRRYFFWLYFLLFPFTAICQSDSPQNLDPFGIGMSVISITVVFVVLVLLYLLFKNLGGIFIRNEKRVLKKSVQASTKDAPTKEEIAAISLAFNMYIKDMQEQEQMTLTISKVSRSYSPWNSKIYGVGILTRN